MDGAVLVLLLLLLMTFCWRIALAKLAIIFKNSRQHPFTSKSAMTCWTESLRSRYKIAIHLTVIGRWTESFAAMHKHVILLAPCEFLWHTLALIGLDLRVGAVVVVMMIRLVARIRFQSGQVDWSIDCDDVLFVMVVVVVHRYWKEILCKSPVWGVELVTVSVWCFFWSVL